MSAKGIKTHQVTKDIRAIDKAATAAERIKTATIKTKDEAIATQQPREDSASEYASDTAMDTLHASAVEAQHHAVKQASKAFDAAKEKMRSAQGESASEDIPYEGASEYGHAYWETPAVNQPTTQYADIKTRERVEQLQPATRTRSPETIYQEQGRQKAVTDAKTKTRERQRVALREQAQHQADLHSGSQTKTHTAGSPMQSTGISSVPEPTKAIGDNTRPTKPRIKGRASQVADTRIKSTSSAVKAGKPRTRSIKTATQSIKTGEQTAKTAVKTVERTAAAAKATAKQSVEAVKTAQIASKAAAKAAQAAKATEQALAKAAHAIAEAAHSALAAIITGGWVSILIAVIISLFGVVVCLFAGNGANSTAELSISEEVYAYYDDIADAAGRYGIAEYIQLIEAVMMQESGGQGLDPMQASECGYNTRFPNTPNSITDPVYSIDCGVHELADCLASAGVEGPSDLEHISLALQGYNYGSGYISWAKRTYGGYTAENAVEFSEMMKVKLGTSVYGDPEYVPHVLRYYSYNFLMAGNVMGGQVMIAVAGNEIGYHEQADGYTKYGAWYGMPYDEWCAMFVSWCADQCGFLDTGLCPNTASTGEIMSWFQRKNQWFDRSSVPPVGAYVLFDWDGDGVPNHVGLVEFVQDGNVHTIEGNSSKSVRRNSYALDSTSIMGYGIPMYWS